MATVGTHSELLGDERYKAILSQEADELEDLADEVDEEVGAA